MTKLELHLINKVIVESIDGYNLKFKEEIENLPDETLEKLSGQDIITIYESGMRILLDNTTVKQEKL